VPGVTIVIPAWLLWTVAIGVGVPTVLATLALALFGWIALTSIGSARLM
jgi:hypothetical protein